MMIQVEGTDDGVHRKSLSSPLSINNIMFTYIYEAMCHCRGLLDINPFSTGIDVRRQNLTSKVGPRTQRITYV